QVVRVRLNGVDYIRRIAALGKNLSAFKRMIRRVGPALIIKVVQQANQTPLLFVFAEFASIRSHRGLHREHVAAQGERLGVLVHQGEGGRAVEHKIEEPKNRRTSPIWFFGSSVL